MTRRFVTLDVFTGKPLAGNPLAIVLDCDGLETADMQAIAREFNLSETVFVLPPEKPMHSARVRIFTPGAELPFAGHPTVGTAIYLGTERAGTSGDLLVVIEEAIGVVRCAVKVRPDQPGYAVFDVPGAVEELPGTADKSSIAAALGLTSSEVGFENHKPSRFTAGVPFSFVPVAGLDELDNISVDLAAWEEAFGMDSHAAAFVYCRETTATAHHFAARMFAPSMGILEDAATGSACAAFAGVVQKFDDMPDGSHRLTIEQGYAMGRPSLIQLELDVEGDTLGDVRIGGHAVQVSEGTLNL
ncbi:MAG: PhzF family phenazine biosynthesis protein [Pseudomonadota bacterium]